MSAGLAAGRAVLRRARTAVALVFFAHGLLLSCWVPLVPVLKATHRLDDGTLALALLAISAGSILAMPLAGGIAARRGSRLVTLSGGLGFGLALIAAVAVSGFAALVAVLMVQGAAMGTMDVAMNAQAAAVERRWTRPIMSSFHGIFSIGGIVGAAAAGLLLDRGVAPVITAGLVAGAALAMLVLCGPFLLGRMAEAPEAGPRFVLPRGPLLILGGLCFLGLMAEGAVIDWSAVFLRYERGQDAAVGAMGYAAFSAMMAAGRLFGDRVVFRFGPVATIRSGALLGAAGLALTLLGPDPGMGILGFALLGVGVANVVPTVIGVAARRPGTAPGVAISAVAMLGYAGLLTGPPVIGAASELVGLGGALGLIVAAMLVVAAAAGRVAR